MKQFILLVAALTVLSTAAQDGFLMQMDYPGRPTLVQCCEPDNGYFYIATLVDEYDNPIQWTIYDKNIESVKQYGNAVTVTPAIETVTIDNNGNRLGQIVKRSRCQIAKAPQSFYLKDLLEAHEKARAEHKMDYVDSVSLMQHYGHVLYTVEGKPENIKITTPMDFYIFRAMEDARENSQIFGL